MGQKFDTTKIPRSRNDTKFGIKLPERLTENLAYFLGVHMGDGHMNVIRRGTTVDYYITYHGHIIEEFRWYEEYLKPLIHQLFNKQVMPKPTTRGTVKIEFRSKAIVSFLQQICDLPLGAKKNFGIPSLITHAPRRYQFAFLRGLADTDFSMVWRKREKTDAYPVLWYETSSINLRDGVWEMLQSLGLKMSQGTRYRTRNGTDLQSYYIQISGRVSLDIWLHHIGTSSYNHLKRLEKYAPGQTRTDDLAVTAAV